MARAHLLPLVLLALLMLEGARRAPVAGAFRFGRPSRKWTVVTSVFRLRRGPATATEPVPPQEQAQAQRASQSQPQQQQQVASKQQQPQPGVDVVVDAWGNVDVRPAVTAAAGEEKKGQQQQRQEEEEEDEEKSELRRLQRQWEGQHRGLSAQLAAEREATALAIARADGLQQEVAILKAQLAAAAAEARTQEAQLEAAEAGVKEAAEREKGVKEALASLRLEHEGLKEARAQAQAAAQEELAFQARKAEQARAMAETLTSQLREAVARLAEMELDGKERAALAAAEVAGWEAKLAEKEAALETARTEVAVMKQDVKHLRALRRAAMPAMALLMAGAPGLGFPLRTLYISYAAGAWVAGEEKLANAPRLHRWGKALGAALLAAALQVAARPFLPPEEAVLTVTGSAVEGRALQKGLDYVRAWHNGGA